MQFTWGELKTEARGRQRRLQDGLWQLLGAGAGVSPSPLTSILSKTRLVNSSALVSWSQPLIARIAWEGKAWGNDQPVVWGRGQEAEQSAHLWGKSKM